MPQERLKYRANLAEKPISDMHCPHCGDTDIWRLRRRRLLDRALSHFNRWPYICHGCEKRFWADSRWPAEPQRTSNPPRYTRAKPMTAPTATIEVRAASQEQLDQMLLSLNQAISQFQTTNHDIPAQAETARK